jgi:UDP-2,4-diacetamido-2,4,6-trideoxy-beta-L-altropyranose hydrolase
MADTSLIRLRRVNKHDSYLLYTWANDPLSRDRSFHKTPIGEKEHRNWFAIKLESTSTLFFLAEYDGIPCGQIRFELEEGKAIIHFSISREFRGKGIGKLLLKEGIKTFYSQNNKIDLLVAYVKKSNFPSMRIFQKQGFSEEADTEHSGSIKFVKKRTLTVETKKP